MNYQLDFNAVFHGEYGALLFKGLKLTLLLTVEAWILAILVGTILAVLRLGGGRILQKFVKAYVAYHQNVPMLVQILLWYFGISAILPDAIQTWFNTHNGEFLFSVIAIGLCMAAYISEDLRSGLRAVPHGQQEASRSLGLSYVKTMRYVVLPQAVRVAMPPLINHSVLLFKNTSLAMAIGCAELSYATREIENHTFRTFESYLVATVVYLLISLLIMAAGAATSSKHRIKGR
ncbi:amino acid ABC transporter permease [Pandoraea terrae]|uniref:Amino acid ABC transporter permease n=1 Tax=Pandoraea terrae TaxID=1537710 RepID=A0A5E4SY23_9BURK|nr:amino acid ABC transporter permease [Pandoraea terrae]VVD80720.1 amino acid ABC transporter permease [Pandoraea terrae]